MLRSFSEICWRAVGAANRARKERAPGKHPGELDEAQGPLGVGGENITTITGPRPSAYVTQREPLATGNGAREPQGGQGSRALVRLVGE